MAPRILTDLLYLRAQQHGAKIALEDSQQQLTFNQWLNKSECFASYLHHNQQRGDRVAIYLNNSVWHGPLIFGCLLGAGVFVVISPEVKGNKLAHILSDCAATTLVCDSTTLAHTGELPSSIKNLICTDTVDSDGGLKWTALEEIWRTPLLLPDAPISEDLASLIYTSGSTGQPKGVMHSHSTMLFACASIVEYLHLDASHRILNLLPLSFDYGLYQLLFSAFTGAYVHIAQGFTFPSQVQQLLEDHQISALPSVPTSFQLLSPLWTNQHPQLRLLTSTGEDLLPTTIEQLNQACPNARIYKMYGLTECKRVSYLPAEKILLKPKSVGVAIPGTQVMLLDEEQRPVTLGESGILHVRGAHIMRGYWKAPELSNKLISTCPRTGIRTMSSGDRFTMDEDGDLYFAGRTDKALKIRGIKVTPEEVENCLLLLPQITACAIVDEYSPRTGSQLVAFICSQAEINPLLVRRHCQQLLESHLVPRKIITIDQLPTTSSGKLDRRRLREQLK